MLKASIEKALNEQIAMEANASSSYLAMASWCEIKGLRGATRFFYAQSDEERMHMLKLVKYVNACDGQAKIPALKEPITSWKELREIFEASLKQEQQVSASIYKIVDMAHAEKDYQTNHFLQWYVEEQHEEEGLFKSILSLFDLAGDDSRGLLIIDSEIMKIRAEADAQEAAS